MFLAGAGIAHLDQLLRAGADVSSAGLGTGADISSASSDSVDVSSAGKNFGVEPVFSGALRQRLALKAAAACARLARLREDEHALRDAEQLASFEAAPTPGGRVHRLWRLFATCEGQLNAPHDTRFIRAAIDLLDLPGDIDCVVVASLAQEDSTHENPLGAAARVSAASLRILDDAPRAEVEILALWLADIVLAQRLRWQAPLPLLATTIMHPSLRAISFGNGTADVSSGAGNIRAASGRRPRPSDADWCLSAARAYARAAQEAYVLAGELSRRSEMLLSVAPKLRTKRAARVVDLLLADDCVSAARAAKAARLSDRASRRLFDRLVALGAVRELSGRPNFRLYGL